MPISFDELKKVLLETQLIEESKITTAKTLSDKEHVPFAEALLKLDLISDEQLGSLIAEVYRAPFISLSKISISEDVLRLVPETVAKKQKMISFSRGKDGIQVAMADPSHLEPLQLFAKKLGEPIVTYYATERDIENALHLYHKELQKSFDDLLKEQVAEAGKTTKSDAPVSKILDLLITYAYQDKASDIHIEPEEKESLVRFRIDGVLHDVLTIPKGLHDQIISRIKVLSRLRTDEHLSAQDSKLQMKMEKEDLDIRVSIVPIVNGEKAVLRLLSSRSRQYSLTDLGLNAKDLEKVKNGFKNPYGMVLATGPTGSGKTTTIYSILKIINTRERNIATIEDPVEYDIQGVNQIQVNSKTNLTFADGLRSILRQDPDIIFVGEIRDAETANIAINSALTGHLVLSTLHTNDAATTLPRLIDMGIEPFLVASTVNVIVAQRLVRKICESCRVSEIVDLKTVSENIPETLCKKHFGNKKEIRLYHGKGCPVCHGSGYMGRIGVFEVIEVTSNIKELIVSKADSEVIRKKAIEEGMTTMLEDGVEKVNKGLTSIEEIIRVAKV